VDRYLLGSLLKYAKSRGNRECLIQFKFAHIVDEAENHGYIIASDWDEDEMFKSCRIQITTKGEEELALAVIEDLGC
jgi:hypothetical protein